MFETGFLLDSAMEVSSWVWRVCLAVFQDQRSDAQVVKLVDTLASGASARKGVEVQVLSWAPTSTL